MTKPRLDQGVDYERGFVDGMQHQMQSSVDKAVNRMAQPEQCQCPNCRVTLHASDCAVHNEPAYPKGACNCGEQPKNEPVAWKIVPIKPTDEMLKAMDECSTEGYDERLYAGHAASVYMAAVDVAPIPPLQKQEPVLWAMPDGKTVDKWALQFYGGQKGKPLYTTPPQRKPLTEWQITEIYTKWESTKGTSWADLIRAIEAAHGIKE